MTVVATNLIAGPADVWVAAFGTAEPADPITVPIAPWRNVGGTSGGVRLTSARAFYTLEVDQIIQRVGSVPTQEDFGIATALAEGTLENLLDAYNVLATEIQSGASSDYVELGGTQPGSTPNYVAVILDGLAPNGKRRRVTLRKGLSTEAVEMAYQKAGQTLIPVTWSGHYVSASIRPIRIEDDTAV